MAIIGSYSQDGSIIRAHDGAMVPADEQNRDYRQMLAQIEAGDVVAPFVHDAPTADEVKAEAGRRIVAIMPDYVQRNTMALALETMQQHGPDPANWPKDLQAINAAAQAKWAAIKVIRARSNEIEAMIPIPSDFREDSYWNG